MKSSLPFRIGAHTSTVGGLENALWEGHSIGANTVQLFTRNQKRWESPPLSEEEISRFQKAKKDTGIDLIMSHDSYLINLGSPRTEILEKSQKAFATELLRCHQLEITYLNFHPGAALDGSEMQCLDTIITSLQQIIPLARQGNTRLLLETTAGQGSSVGYSFTHIAYLLQALASVLPMGVCIDTCHIFAAGYDIRTQETLEHTLQEFDKVIGLEHLYAFHINDSLKGLGSRVDRHAPLGEGAIGMSCFQLLMQHPQTRHLPKYLETPGGPSLWKQEIATLKQLGYQE